MYAVYPCLRTPRQIQRQPQPYSATSMFGFVSSPHGRYLSFDLRSILVVIIFLGIFSTLYILNTSKSLYESSKATADPRDATMVCNLGNTGSFTRPSSATLQSKHWISRTYVYARFPRRQELASLVAFFPLQRKRKRQCSLWSFDMTSMPDFMDRDAG